MHAFCDGPSVAARRDAVRITLAIATLSMSGCFAVDAVSTPYDEQSSTSTMLPTEPAGTDVMAAPSPPPPAPTRCRPDGAFSRQEEFYKRTDGPVFGVRLLPDESIAYGTVIANGIWTLARITPGADPLLTDFKIEPVTNVAYPSPTADGSVIFFARYDPVTNTRESGDIYLSRREKGAPFEGSSTVPLDADAEDSTPYVTPQADTLYFTRYERDHYVILRIALPAVARTEAGVFTREAAPPGDNVNPVVTPDELTLFFAARSALGDLDIWTAQSPKKEARFRDAHPIAELRTSGDDVPSWISPDGCVLYFERWETAQKSTIMRAYRD